MISFALHEPNSNFNMLQGLLPLVHSSTASQFKVVWLGIFCLLLFDQLHHPFSTTASFS